MRYALIALALAGCATLMAGGPDEIPVRTNPPGAYVYVNGIVVGQTPMVVHLSRNAPSGYIRLYLPGYQPVDMIREKSLNLWIIADVFPWLALLFPIIVDLADGDWQRYDDSPIAIGLVPAPNAPAPQWAPR